MRRPGDEVAIDQKTWSTSIFVRVGSILPDSPT
jgi:hypothetical protein